MAYETLNERCAYFGFVFEQLKETDSRLDKEYIVNQIPYELIDDWSAILEALNGRYVFGYRMRTWMYEVIRYTKNENLNTIRACLEYLAEPRREGNLSMPNIIKHLEAVSNHFMFFQEIVDKELKLGIGASLLEKSELAPMLAKKYDGDLVYSHSGYFVTEKLDGNRCIAFHDGKEWNFISRNGKRMFVNFDMAGLPAAYVYDGEVLSPEQVEMSESIAAGLKTTFDSKFNSTSGLINRHTSDKKLIYNIFDIQANIDYTKRREILDKLIDSRIGLSSNVRILPVLAHFQYKQDLQEKIDELLSNVTSVGGEGLMINIGSANYLHKRTNDLLKYKEVQTMDMLVTDIYAGEGKYIGQVGGITCQAVLSDGKVVNCNVGTGLSDEQRFDWARDKSLIVGKVVEIAYFSLSENKNTIGKSYSLRFPRFKKIRQDKISTSEY